MYQKVLIATDGTELAGRALTHGLALAKSVRAPVVVVTVTEVWSPLDIMNSEDGRGREAIAGYETRATNYASGVLATAAKEASAVGVECETVHVKDRDPFDGILVAARNAGCDLIVISTHGRRGMDRLLLGSVANEVLTYAKIPVLVVR